jgi:hypothetical protein
MSFSRRSFLHASGMAAFAIPLEALRSRLEAGLPVASEPGYGPLSPVRDAATGLPLLELPEGFRYTTFGWTGDPLEDGRRTPSAHDGMAAFDGGDGRVVLIRNHEIGPGSVFSEKAYDRNAGGGTTTLVFDPASERLVSARASLSGTIRNCAGGPTPWNTWLSCEESLAGPRDRSPLPRQHGYVFEVPLTGDSNAEPIKAMGCFVHEAAAVDPRTGIVYETQDRGQSGLYRFVPNTPGQLAKGGQLQMLAVDGTRRFDTSRGQRPGFSYPIHWEDIRDPDRAHHDGTDGLGVLQQGLDRGGATFSRLEGAWFGDGRLFVTATDGGNARMGQVWELDPERSILRLIFESTGAPLVNMPDNITVSPRGGLVLCENGSPMVQRIHGLTLDGRVFRFARNNVVLSGERNGLRGDFTRMEFAGATFSPDGRWLFFNVQVPGITVAVTGPWGEGSL